jgi:hypothetical protein
MKEPVLTHQTNRREMLKLSGMGVLGGVAAGTLISGKVQAADPAVRIAYASWIHGHSMQVEYPDRIASEWRAGFSFTLEGKPGSDNWFHFAIPTPVIINDVRLHIDSAMLCFRTGSDSTLVRDVHVYDGANLIAAHDSVNYFLDNPFQRFLVPDHPMLWAGIGISVGVAFGAEATDRHIEFFSAGCDFVIPEPA